MILGEGGREGGEGKVEREGEGRGGRGRGERGGEGEEGGRG